MTRASQLAEGYEVHLNQMNHAQSIVKTGAGVPSLSCWC